MTEDRWTPPSSWCPHPEWWTAEGNPDVTEHEVTHLVQAFIVALQPEVAVETGTSTGATARLIGNALAANGHGHLWTVELDTWLAEAATRNLVGLPVTVVHGDTLTWWPPEQVDFAWIDSGSAMHRLTEISRWRGAFRPGAVIGVHDTAPNQGREVLRSGLESLLAQLGWQSLSLRTPRGVTFAQVAG
jgi:predicted O-methyltransferase YrrM